MISIQNQKWIYIMQFTSVLIAGSNSSYVAVTSETQANSQPDQASTRVQQISRNPMRELSQKQDSQQTTLQEQKLKESIKDAKELLCLLKNLSDQITCIDGIITLLNSEENSSLDKAAIEKRCQATEELEKLKATLSIKLKEVNTAPRSVQAILSLAKREIEAFNTVCDEVTRISHFIGSDDDDDWDRLTSSVVDEFNNLSDKMIARQKKLNSIADQLSIKLSAPLTKKIEKKAHLITPKPRVSAQTLPMACIKPAPKPTSKKEKKDKTEQFPSPGSYEDLTYMLEYKPVRFGYT